MSRPGALADYVEWFRLRCLQSALDEATSAHWLRRAEAFERVGTPECDEVAKACAFAEASPLEPVADLLRDVRAS